VVPAPVVTAAPVVAPAPVDSEEALAQQADELHLSMLRDLGDGGLKAGTGSLKIGRSGPLQGGGSKGGLMEIGGHGASPDAGAKRSTKKP